MNNFIEQFVGQCAISTLNVCKPTNDNENFYFLAGVNDTTTRKITDKDIIIKNYFSIDLDLRKDVLALTGVLITDTDILEIANKLEIKLSGTPFGEWRYIVFSGNGLHIHYIGEPIVNPDPAQYKYAVQGFLKEFIELVDNSPYIQPDTLCVNLARLMRLPGTYNHRQHKYPTLDKVLCTVLMEQPGKISSLFNNIITTKIQHDWSHLEIKRYEIKSPKREYKNNNNDELKLIPIEEVIAQIGLIPAIDFRNNNWIDKDGNNFSFYKDDKANFIHINPASSTLAPYIKNNKKGWDNFDVVMNMLGKTFPEAVEYLKTNF